MEHVYRLWKMKTTSSSGILKSIKSNIKGILTLKLQWWLFIVISIDKIRKFWNLTGIAPLTSK